MLRQSLRIVSRRNPSYVCLSCRVLGAGFAAPVRPARYYSTAAGISDAKADTAHANVIPPAMGRVDIRNVSIKPKSPQKAKNNKKEAQNATKKTPVRVRGVAPRKPDSARQRASMAHVQRMALEKEKATSQTTKVQQPKRRVKPNTRASAVKTDASEPAASQDKDKVSVPLVHGAKTIELDEIHSTGMEITALNTESASVPRLSYGLDRVLFNPGIYHLQDPRSRVYNFDPYLRSIMPVSEFDFDVLNEYITSSRDTKLRDMARERNLKYVGSSSSMTSVLSHFHYLLSQWRPVTTSMLSKNFVETSNNFTKLMRAPSAVFLRYRDGVYAIDADKEFDTANVLMNLGKSMERLLTMPKDQFERYRKSSDNKMTSAESDDESYHYTTMGDFLMRGQLDAWDPRLPGTGMFDLKTRAVLSVRMDAQNYEEGMGYQLRKLTGEYESFEREYFDMIRAAFLKYSLQVRMGRMDGIFVAYHNVERIFGFQYISLPEMDFAIHGQKDLTLGDAEFKISLNMWNKILNRATAKYPKQSLRFHFETRETQIPYMYVFAEPVADEEIDRIQTRNKEEIDAFQMRILHPELFEAEEVNEEALEAALEAAENEDISDDVVSTTDGTLEMSFDKDGATVTDGEETTTTATETERETTTEDSSETEIEAEAGVEANDGADKPLFAMAISIENRVNGLAVERPDNLDKKCKWTVHYRLSEMGKTRGRGMYNMCQKRRKKALNPVDEKATAFTEKFRMKLKALSARGRAYQKVWDRIDEQKGTVWYDQRTETETKE